MKKGILLIFTLIIALIVFADNWEKVFNMSISMNLNNYSDNWDGEESSNFNWSFVSNTNLKKQMYSWMNIANRISLSFGQTISKAKGDSVWGDFEKSLDIIEMENIERFTLNFFVDPFAGVRLESQFTDKVDSASTYYLNPVKLTESFGIAKVLYEKDKSNITSRLGGAIKQDMNRYALIDTLQNIRDFDMKNDGGIEFITEALLQIKENMTYEGRLILYKALFNSKESELASTSQADDWKSIDMDFKNNISIIWGKHTSLNLSVLINYDKEIDDNIRIMEMIGLGINF